MASSTVVSVSTPGCTISLSALKPYTTSKDYHSSATPRALSPKMEGWRSPRERQIRQALILFLPRRLYGAPTLGRPDIPVTYLGPSDFSQELPLPFMLEHMKRCISGQASSPKYGRTVERCSG